MKTLDSFERAARARGECEQRVMRGGRSGQMCLNRARWRWTADGGDHRVCGIHARAYTRKSLREIGTPRMERRVTSYERCPKCGRIRESGDTCRRCR